MLSIIVKFVFKMLLKHLDLLFSTAFFFLLPVALACIALTTVMLVMTNFAKNKIKINLPSIFTKYGFSLL